MDKLQQVIEKHRNFSQENLAYLTAFFMKVR
ncbi:hypothetical protein SAMN04488574_11812 [Bacillus sp. 71mf]|nr:hypothetical protein SAMN04488574_11812 [Bacillus sp. 71mf]SFS68551.1 hypothetical protein SAMN04488145_102468 [Bacillus sp. 103mf]